MLKHIQKSKINKNMEHKQHVSKVLILKPQKTKSHIIQLNGQHSRQSKINEEPNINK